MVFFALLTALGFAGPLVSAARITDGISKYNKKQSDQEPYRGVNTPNHLYYIYRHHVRTRIKII